MEDFNVGSLLWLLFCFVCLASQVVLLLFHIGKFPALFCLCVGVHGSLVLPIQAAGHGIPNGSREHGHADGHLRHRLLHPHALHHRPPWPQAPAPGRALTRRRPQVLRLLRRPVPRRGGRGALHLPPAQEGLPQRGPCRRAGPGRDKGRGGLPESSPDGVERGL